MKVWYTNAKTWNESNSTSAICERSRRGNGRIPNVDGAVDFFYLNFMPVQGYYKLERKYIVAELNG